MVGEGEELRLMAVPGDGSSRGERWPFDCSVGSLIVGLRAVLVVSAGKLRVNPSLGAVMAGACGHLPTFRSGSELLEPAYFWLGR